MLRESDYIQQVANYIKKNLAKGYTVESLRWALMYQGYSRSAIDNAIKQANEQLAMAAPKMVEKPFINVTPNPEVQVKLSFWQRVKSWFG